MITGGSSGIGKCLAAEAILEGASLVCLVARNKDKLKDAKKELEKLIIDKEKQRVQVVSADVSQESVIESLKDAVKEAGREVDVLVNCAGITHTAPMTETPPHLYKELLCVNVLGSVYPTKAVLPSMVNRRSGAIVFISSQAGQLSLYGYSAYSATKYGMKGLAETLQMEMRPHNVQISISFPPDTDTPQLQAEVPQRSPIMTDLAAFGKTFQPQQIAKEVWAGVESGTFQITHGLDGFLLGTLTAGMSPAHSIWTALTQVLLMGMFRMVGLVYMMLFDRVVAQGVKEENKKKLK